MGTYNCKICKEEIQKEEYFDQEGFCDACIAAVQKLSAPTPLEKAAEILDKKAESYKEESERFYKISVDETGDSLSRDASVFREIAKALRGEY